MKIYTTEGKIIPDVQDALYELGNAGTGMVSVSIGKLLNIRISISVPEVVSTLSGKSEVYDGEDRQEVVVFIMHMKETMQGTVSFILDQEIVHAAIEALTGKNYELQTMMESECGHSAIQEFGNIIGSSYVKALGQYTGIRFFLSPVMACLEQLDGVQALIDQQMPQENKSNIFVASQFSMVSADGEKIGPTGKVIMKPNDKSVEKIMEAIGI